MPASLIQAEVKTVAHVCAQFGHMFLKKDVSCTKQPSSSAPKIDTKLGKYRSTQIFEIALISSTKRMLNELCYYLGIENEERNDVNQEFPPEPERLWLDA